MKKNYISEGRYIRFNQCKLNLVGPLFNVLTIYLWLMTGNLDCFDGDK